MAGSQVRRHVAAILWPSFLMAGVLEALVFAMVDPAQLHWLGGGPLEWPAQAIYTGAFFVFWVVVAASGLMTRLLEGSPEDINREGFSGAFRR
jgi:hypothetical protein